MPNDTRTEFDPRPLVDMLFQSLNGVPFQQGQVATHVTLCELARTVTGGNIDAAALLIIERTLRYFQLQPHRPSWMELTSSDKSSEKPS